MSPQGHQPHQGHQGRPVTFRGEAGPIAGDEWRPGREPKGVVLFLHGGGQTRHSWFRSAANAATHGWTGISLDARGHGDSAWAADGDYSVDAMVDDVAAVVATLGERPVLVGASMGGMTAMIGEGERGDLARALVLVDIVPRTAPAGVARVMAFMKGHPDGFASLADAAEAVAAYNPHRARPASPDGLRKNLRLRPDGRWYWHWDPAFLQAADEARLVPRQGRAAAAAARITVPTLLVRGEQSDVVDDAGVEELLRLVPGARAVQVPATGHMVAGDDNDVFTERLLDFLDVLGGPPGAAPDARR